MNTTNLFVELILIGFGTLIGLVLFVLLFFDYEYSLILFEKISKGILPIYLIPLYYLLGIVTDRLADRFVRKIDRKIRYAIFKDNNALVDAQMLIYMKSQSIKNLIEYSRSRLRICRGWILNSILILILSNLYIWMKLPDSKLISSIVISLLSVTSLFGFYKSWSSLTKKEYNKLFEFSSSIKRVEHNMKDN